MAWTSDDLVADIKRRAALPENGAQFSGAEIMATADEEILITLVPDILRVRSEYMVDVFDQAIVPNQRNYGIPPDAIGDKLRDVVLLDQNGNGYPLPQLNIEQVDMYGSAGNASTAYAVGFVMQGSEVILVPKPTQSNYTLRMRYYKRPSKLTPVANCLYTGGIVEASNHFLTLTTIAALPPVLQGNLVDLVTGVPPYRTKVSSWTGLMSVNFQYRYAVNTAEVIADIEEKYVVGDYVTPTGYTCFPQVPVEMMGYLAQCVATRLLEAMGYEQQAKIAALERGRMAESMQALISPRVDGKRTVVIARSSPLRSGRRGGRGTGGIY